MESFATDEGVGVGKEVVLDPDLGDGTLAQLAHEAAHVVEAALAGVAIYENGQCVVSAMHSLEHLGPGRLVAEARGVCQARVLNAGSSPSAAPGSTGRLNLSARARNGGIGGGGGAAVGLKVF